MAAQAGQVVQEFLHTEFAAGSNSYAIDQLIEEIADDINITVTVAGYTAELDRVKLTMSGALPAPEVGPIDAVVAAHTAKGLPSKDAPGYTAYITSDDVNGGGIEALSFDAGHPTKAGSAQVPPWMSHDTGTGVVTILADGYYSLTYTVSVAQSGGLTGEDVTCWLRVNDVNVSGTKRRESTTPGAKGSCSASVLLRLDKDDELTVTYQAASNVHAQADECSLTITPA